MSEPAFHGRTGSQQQQLLRDWVLAAVADLYPDAVSAEPHFEIQPALAALDDRELTKASATSASFNSRSPVAPELPHGRQSDRAVDDRRFLQQAAPHRRQRPVLSREIQPSL